MRKCLFSLWMRESQDTDLLEDSKFALGMKVECLRFWRVCGMHGVLFASVQDFFPCICRELQPPMPNKTTLDSSSSSYTLSKELYLTFAVVLGDSRNPPMSNSSNQDLKAALISMSTVWLQLDFLFKVRGPNLPKN